MDQLDQVDLATTTNVTENTVSGKGTPKRHTNIQHAIKCKGEKEERQHVQLTCLQAMMDVLMVWRVEQPRLTDTEFTCKSNSVAELSCCVKENKVRLWHKKRQPMINALIYKAANDKCFNVKVNQS